MRNYGTKEGGNKEKRRSKENGLREEAGRRKELSEKKGKEREGSSEKGKKRKKCGRKVDGSRTEE